jgi:hypothetical protein
MSNRNAHWQIFMCAFCFLFGLAMIANTQLPGDGLWFWYASLLHDGKRLYADMHLPLQPLFVLEADWCMDLFGKSWLASKIPAVLHLAAFILASFFICQYSTWTDRRKAIIIGSAFFISVCSGLIRLDDYHILEDCFVVYSILLLLMLQRAASERYALSLVAGLGALSGLAFTSRVNDGGMLLAAVAVAIICMAPFRKILSLFLFGVTTAAVVVLIVHMTGDTFHDYLANSIFKAAASKGGAGDMLTDPIMLPWNTLVYLANRKSVTPIIYCLIEAGCWTFLWLPFVRSGYRRERPKAVIGIVVAVFVATRLYWMLLDASFAFDMTTLSVFALYALGTIAFVRFLRWQFSTAYTWDPREILLLIPLGQMISGSMSSGGFHSQAYVTTAVLILLVPIASPIQLKSESGKSFFLAVAAILLCYGISYKIRIPYYWHSYRSQTLFVGRQWYRHPIYGPMIIETGTLEFIKPICTEVTQNNPQQELLSLPYPFANYFCGITPWHGYVQTFFDTSTKQTIDTLIDDLKKSPPTWILYERQLDSLSVHEKVYNRGQTLPHRYLDQLIEQKLADGEWQAVSTSNYAETEVWSNQWILIRTHP